MKSIAIYRLLQSYCFVRLSLLWPKYRDSIVSWGTWWYLASLENTALNSVEFRMSLKKPENLYLYIESFSVCPIYMCVCVCSSLSVFVSLRIVHDHVIQFTTVKVYCIWRAKDTLNEWNISLCFLRIYVADISNLYSNKLKVISVNHALRGCQ